MKFKKEAVIVGVILIALVVIISNFFPLPRLAQGCGECTEWVNKECGGSAGNIVCEDLVMLQKRTCFPPQDQMEVQEWSPDTPPLSPKREQDFTEQLDSEDLQEKKPVEEINLDENEETTEDSDTGTTEDRDTGTTSSSKQSTNKDSESFPTYCTARCAPMPEVCNTAPGEPSNPDPSNLETGVEINTSLAWEASDSNNQELLYNIYFGTTDVPELIEEEYNATIYNISYDLDYSSNYFWKIIVDDGYNETNGSVWMFTTEGEPNYPPQEPSNPIPEDGANNTTITPILYWTSSDQNEDELSYDVYFGTEILDLISNNQTETNFTLDPLNYSTTYFWKIVVTDGVNETNGTIWNFTTGVIPNNPPNQPTNITPSNNSTNVPTNIVLTWSGEDPDGDTLTYDIYFDTDSEPEIVSTAQTNEYYIPELNYSTTYFWKVVAIDEHSATSSSDILTFTTREEEILVESNTNDPYALFDVKVELHENTNIAYPGGDIYADIILYNMGTIRPVDVILDCTLEDMEKNVFDYFQETLMVESQTQIERKMTMPASSEVGNYVFSCVLSYADEVAVSQDLFRIIEQEIHEEEPTVNYDIYKLILITLLVLTIVLFVKIKKKRRRKRKK